MTTRDRIVLMAVLVLVVVGAGWMLVVSPERKEAQKLNGQITTAEGEVSSAQSKLAEANSAKSRYATAYSSIVNLGKAVPAQQEVPSLIYQLTGATQSGHVEFNSIGLSGASAAPTSTEASSTAATSVLSTMPFSVTFTGGFFDLEKLFNRLTALTNYTSGSQLSVNGRLITITGVKLAPVAAAGTTGAGATDAPTTEQLTGDVTAAAYVLPAGSSLTGSATAESPTGAATTSPTATTPTPTTTSSAPAAAVVKVTP